MKLVLIAMLAFTTAAMAAEKNDSKKQTNLNFSELISQEMSAQAQMHEAMKSGLVKSDKELLPEEEQSSTMVLGGESFLAEAPPEKAKNLKKTELKKKAEKQQKDDFSRLDRELELLK